MASKYFGQVPGKQKQSQRIQAKYQPFRKTIKKKTYQIHCMLGTDAYPVLDERRTAVHLLNNVLCGIGSNSRLHTALREKNGFSYNIESNYTPYTDTGLLTIYFSTDKNNLEKSIQVIHKEIKKIRSYKLGTLQLSKAKRQLTGHTAIAAENKENFMLSMGKSYMLFGKAHDVDEINKRIEKVTASQLLDIANEILDPEHFSTLVYH